MLEQKKPTSKFKQIYYFLNVLDGKLAAVGQQMIQLSRALQVATAVGLVLIEKGLIDEDEVKKKIEQLNEQTVRPVEDPVPVADVE